MIGINIRREDIPYSKEVDLGTLGLCDDLGYKIYFHGTLFDVWSRS